MFNSSNSTSSAPKLFTGLANFQVLGVNPTKSEIEAWLGREYKLTVNNDIVDMSGRSMRPIEIWLQETSKHMEPISMRFYISPEDDVAQTGSKRYVNDKGVFTYSKGTEDDLKMNEKLHWFNMHPFRVAKVGEYELFTFMQKLMRYNNRDEKSAFMNDAENSGITIEKLFNNDFSGLHKFFNWCNDNKNTIVLIAGVRSTSKMVDGEPKIYYNQTIVNNPNFFFSSSTGEVSARAFGVVKEAIDKGERVTKYLYTIPFQAFVKDECYNAVPDTAVASSTIASYNPTKLL